MGGDGGVRKESIILACLSHRVVGYLRDFVGFAAFFPSNETFCPFFFFFPLALAVPLLLASGSDGVDFFFFFLATGVSLFLRGLLRPVASDFFWGFLALDCLKLIFERLDTAFHC